MIDINCELHLVLRRIISILTRHPSPAFPCLPLHCHSLLVSAHRSGDALRGSSPWRKSHFHRRGACWLPRSPCITHEDVVFPERSHCSSSWPSWLWLAHETAVVACLAIEWIELQWDTKEDPKKDQGSKQVAFIDKPLQVGEDNCKGASDSCPWMSPLSREYFTFCPHHPWGIWSSFPLL